MICFLKGSEFPCNRLLSNCFSLATPYFMVLMLEVVLLAVQLPFGLSTPYSKGREPVALLMLTYKSHTSSVARLAEADGT